MPRRLTAEQKIAKAEAKASEAAHLKVQGFVDRAKTLLAKHPGLAKEVVEFIEATIERQTKGFAKEVDPGDKKPTTTLIGCHTKLDATPSRTLKLLLQAMNPMVFSSGNLRSFCTKHQREPPKGPLAECVEFACGLSMVAIIPKEHRDVSVMCELVQADYKANGCVADRLALPPDWGRDGWYESKTVAVVPTVCGSGGASATRACGGAYLALSMARCTSPTTSASTAPRSARHLARNGSCWPCCTWMSARSCSMLWLDPPAMATHRLRFDRRTWSQVCPMPQNLLHRAPCRQARIRRLHLRTAQRSCQRWPTSSRMTRS